jgi:hypothetical protein
MGELLPPRPQFQPFDAQRKIDSDLALYTERLQRDRVRRAADQHVAAEADPERRAALCAGVVAGQIARSEPRYRRVDGPSQRRFLGDADVEPDLADGGDVAVIRRAIDAQHATKIGDRTNDEADARAAASFEHADLHARHWLLRSGACDGGKQRRDGYAGEDRKTAHEEISG